MLPSPYRQRRPRLAVLLAALLLFGAARLAASGRISFVGTTTQPTPGTSAVLISEANV